MSQNIETTYENGTERPEDAARRLATDVLYLEQKNEGLKEAYAEENARCNELTTENYILLQALQEIAADTDEAGGVRVAVAAILKTANGPAFLIANPIT